MTADPYSWGLDWSDTVARGRALEAENSALRARIAELEAQADGEVIA